MLMNVPNLISSGYKSRSDGQHRSDCTFSKGNIQIFLYDWRHSKDEKRVMSTYPDETYAASIFINENMEILIHKVEKMTIPEIEAKAEEVRKKLGA